MAYHRFGDRGSGSRRSPNGYQRDDGRMYDDDHYTQDDGDYRSDRYDAQEKGSSRNPHWRAGDGDDGLEPPIATAGAGPDGGMHIRGRAVSPGHSSSMYGQQYHPHGYRDRDHADYISPHRRDREHSGARGPSLPRHYGRGRSRSSSRSRSRARRPPRSPTFGGPLSREVMLDGIPLDLKEEDITYQLKTHYGLDDLRDVRVIRDRDTKKSRGFAFIRFAGVREAGLFLEENYPTIYLDDAQSSVKGQGSQRVRVAFSREREDRQKPQEAEGGWLCPSCSTLNFAGRDACFRCHAVPLVAPQHLDVQAQQQDRFGGGDSDAAMQGPPSQFLLIRGLEGNTSEELLSKGASKLLKPGASQQNLTQPTAKKSKITSTTGDANLGAKEGSLRRVFLVRDRQTDKSWRYGFAEFSNLDEAAAALTRFNSFDRFTISSKSVTVSYIHMGVFVPVNNPYDDPRFSFTPLANQSLRLMYWNDQAYVSELVINAHEDDSAANTAVNDAANAAAKAAAREGIVSTEDPDAIKKRKAEAKGKETSKAKKSTPAHLQFWSNRHAELHGIKQPNEQGSSETKSTGSDISELPQERSTSVPATQSYADPKKNCCYLCSRQFKTAVEVNKHERLSKLHQDNLQNEGLLKKALAKLAKAGVTANTTTSGDGTTGTEYRNRAKERREIFGGARIPLPLKKNAASGSDVEETSSNPNQLVEQPTSSELTGMGASTAAAMGPDAETAARPLKSKSKGAALLGKMGWTAGEGLGARGEGATSTIDTNAYAAGVGLGAEGGKLGDAAEEAARNSRSGGPDGYREFLQRTRDKAKQRYENM